MFRLSVISSTATFQLRTSSADVIEGTSYTITLDTTGVQMGQVIPYTITGVTQVELGGEPLTGNFIVNGNTASKTFTAQVDANKTMVLTLDDRGVTTSVAVNDVVVITFDSDWDKVVFLSHFDGADAGTTFTDEKLHVVTAFGGARTVVANKKFGTSSITNPSGTAYSAARVSFGADINFVTDNWTIEAWILRANSSPLVAICGFTQADNDGNWFMYTYSNGKLALGRNGINEFTSAVGVITPGVWTHVAAVKTGSTINLFANGTLVATTGSASSYITAPANPFNVYANGNSSYVDEVRITKNLARYTANFTPATAAFPTQIELEYDWFWNNTVLEVKGGNNGVTTGSNSTFVDSSVNNLTITKFGTASQGTFSPFGTTGGSVYLAGDGNYLELPANNTATAFQAGNFTIEGWWYFKDGSANIVRSMFHNYSGAFGANSIFFGKHTVQSGRVVLYLGNNGSPLTLTDPNLPPDNAWVHYALVRNGSTISLYRNGVSVASSSIGSISLTGATVANGYTAGYCYTSNFRIVKGTAVYTSNFTVPTAPLTAITNTTVLLKFEGANIVDDTHRNNLQVIGSTSLSTSVKKNGVASMSFNGTTDYLTVPPSADFAFGTGDFTIEYWCYSTSAADKGQLQISGTSGGLNASGTGGIYISYGSYGGKWQIATGSGSSLGNISSTMSLNTWHHIALVRASGVSKFYVDGTLLYTVADTYNYTAQNLAIGGYWSTGNLFTGYIDDIRITKGIARYSSGFTPKTTEPSSRAPTGAELSPTTYDPFWQQVVLAMNMEGANNGTVFTDAKSHSTTVYGNSSTKTAQSKFGSTSAYFDGTGDYVSIAAGADLSFGTGDFTIEAWFNASSFGVSGMARGSIIAHGHWPWALVTYIDSSGKNILQFFCSSDGSAGNMYSGLGQDGAQCSAVGTSITTNAWHHVAITRRGTTLYCFVDGIQQSTWSSTLPVYSAPATPVCVGGTSNGNQANMFNGYIDDVRITKGIARYTSNFTVPAIANPTNGAAF